MGDIVQLKKKESKKGKTRTPKVYANLDECWQDLIKELDLYEHCFPANLDLNQRCIFTLGMIAGERREQGLWTGPEDMKLH